MLESSTSELPPVSSPDRFWHQLAHHLRQGRSVFVALVVDHTRHSPGTSGARMLITLSGGEEGTGSGVIASGTIGGGIMEHRLIERAKDVLRRGEPFAEVAALHHSRDKAAGQPSGMICAGRQSNLYFLCRPSSEGTAVDRLCTLVDRGESAVLEISHQGWRVEARAADFDRPQHRLEVSSDGEFVYRQQLLNRRRLALFGGGHCALALASLTQRLGYEVFAFEGPKKAADARLGRHVRGLEQVADFADAAARVNYPEITQAVVLTSDFPSDVRALCGALRRPFPFIGVMGSSTKIAEIRQRLLAEGFTHEDLERLVAPVGLPMLSNTPQEIAVSIAAQLLQLRVREEIP